MMVNKACCSLLFMAWCAPWLSQPVCVSCCKRHVWNNAQTTEDISRATEECVCCAKSLSSSS